jgi:hypothetical protein
MFLEIPKHENIEVLAGNSGAITLGKERTLIVNLNQVQFIDILPNGKGKRMEISFANPSYQKLIIIFNEGSQDEYQKIRRYIQQDSILL